MSLWHGWWYIPVGGWSVRIFDFRAFRSPHNQPIIHVALPLSRPFQVIIGGHSWKYIALSATVYTLHSLMIGLKIDPPRSGRSRYWKRTGGTERMSESVLESWKDVFYPTVPFPSCIPVFLFFPRSCLLLLLQQPQSRSQTLVKPYISFDRPGGRRSSFPRNRINK